jgi:serine/threonine protein kinase
MSYRSTGERADSLAAGRVIGDYEIESIAASGGMGIVYRATQRSLGRRVALKVIRSEIAADPDYRARFMRESRQAAAVDHPNVVSVHEVGNHNGQLFLAMQWIEGSDLEELIKRKGRLAEDQAVRIALQLAGALQAVHDAGLIHRDVKPPNVLLRQVGGEDHTYLTDFGVAKPLLADEKFTKSGLAVGTSGYMAPEQIQGLEPMPQTDLYALGCVFYRLLTGSAPFHATNDLALAWAHLHNPRPTPSTTLPELGERYDDFIAMALAIEPGNRFRSGRAFATALKTVHGQPAHHVTVGPTAADTYVPPEPTLVDPPPAARTPIDRQPPRQPTALYPPYPQVAEGPQPSPAGRTVALVLLTLVALAGIAVGALAASGVFTKSQTTTVNGPIKASSSGATNSRSRSTSTTRSSKSGNAPPTATTKCDQNISAGQDTSCPLAENTFVAYYDDYKANGQQSSNTVTASSSVTQKSYELHCTNNGQTVDCGGATNTFVTFPFWAIQVYRPPSAPPTQQGQGTSSGGPSGCNCGVADLPVRCDPNISGTSGVHCNFAENTFYEFYKATGGDPTQSPSLQVWSPAYHLYIDLQCTNGDGVVDCTRSGPGSSIDVRFTQDSMSAYTPDQAAAYARSADLGPNG